MSDITKCPLCESGNIPKMMVMRNAIIQKQVRFPRSRKQRICKKWTRDSRNWDFEIGVVSLHKKVVNNET